MENYDGDIKTFFVIQYALIKKHHKTPLFVTEKGKKKKRKTKNQNFPPNPHAPKLSQPPKCSGTVLSPPPPFRRFKLNYVFNHRSALPS
jgi:hypothetical protein